MPCEIQTITFTASKRRESAIVVMDKIPREDDLLPFGSFDEGDEGDCVDELLVGEPGVKVSLFGPLLQVQPSKKDRVDAQVSETHDTSFIEMNTTLFSDPP